MRLGNGLIIIDTYNDHNNTMESKKLSNKHKKYVNGSNTKVKRRKRKHDIEKTSVPLNSHSDDDCYIKNTSDSVDYGNIRNTLLRLDSDSDDDDVNIKKMPVMHNSDSEDGNIKKTDVMQGGSKSVITYKSKKRNNSGDQSVFQNNGKIDNNTNLDTDRTLLRNNTSKTNTKDVEGDIHCLQKNRNELCNKYTKKGRNINEPLIVNIDSGVNQLIDDGDEYVSSINDDNGTENKEQKSVVIDSDSESISDNNGSKIKEIKSVVIECDSDDDCSINEKKKKKKRKRRTKRNGYKKGQGNSGELGNNHHIVNDSETSHTSTMAVLDNHSLTPLYHMQAKDRRKCLEEFKKKGITPKSGKWDTEEIQQLDKNMKEFLELFPVKDLRSLLLPRTKEDRAFRKKSQFMWHMSTGIQRTLYKVMRRTEVQFSNFFYKGKYSGKEAEELKKLYKLHGSNWTEIGVLMNRCRRSLPRIHDYLTSAINKGSWSKEENQRLRKAVSDYLDRGEKKISWCVISKLVGTRDLRQCHQRWLTKDFQSHGNIQSNDILFEDKDIFKLLKMIKESNVEDFYLLDWNDLSKHFNDKITPNWLKWKFGVLSKEVPHSYIMEFDELTEQLYNIYERKIYSDNNIKDITSDVEETSFNDVIIID